MIVEGGGPAVVALARLGPTLKLVADTRTRESLMRGRGTGPIRFRNAGGLTTFGGTLDFVNFSFGSPTAPDWTEATLRLEADGSYTESTDTLAFTVAKVERPGLAIDGAVSFAHFDTTADLRLTGTLTYDFAKLTPKLRELLGGDFSGHGKGSTPISLVGSLSPPVKPGSKNPPGTFAAMNGELRIGWDSLHAYGFDVGRGELHGKLTDGIGRVNPIAATFGGGKVTVQPTLFLDVEPSAVSFAKGKIVEHAKLTPAVCADALGYALPAIAKTGKAEGEISINLDENRIPFADTNKARVKGQIVIHKAAVAPGPVIGEIAKLLGANNVAMTIPNETVVPIRVENGSVHHQNFAVQVAGQTIITSGSVGFDGKLNLIADVPIPAGLLKSSPLAMKALAGKRVQVPISGTLSKPTLDPKLFQVAVAKARARGREGRGEGTLEQGTRKALPRYARPEEVSTALPVQWPHAVLVAVRTPSPEDTRRTVPDSMERIPRAERRPLCVVVAGRTSATSRSRARPYGRKAMARSRRSVHLRRDARHHRRASRATPARRRPRLLQARSRSRGLPNLVPHARRRG